MDVNDDAEDWGSSTLLLSISFFEQSLIREEYVDDQTSLKQDNLKFRKLESILWLLDCRLLNHHRLWEEEVRKDQ